MQKSGNNTTLEIDIAIDHNRRVEDWVLPEDLTTVPSRRDFQGNLVPNTPVILDIFQREIAQFHFRDCELLPPGMKFVFLERWFQEYPWLYPFFKRSVKTSILPKRLHDSEVGTILAIVYIDGINSQRLVTFLHVNLNADRTGNWRPPDMFTHGNRLYCDPDTAYNVDCYFANSGTPHECDQRKGYNTILRKLVISAGNYIGLGRVISAPFEGAYSNAILDKLGFLSDGKVRYLPLTVMEPPSQKEPPAPEDALYTSAE